ncbi:MAG: lipoyl(octanoyl) transferase LipB [Gammaproteobacteria bacterium]|nr:lipoyl(octanoyl) transferase LipB [Gammaproteobacteria bacterium]
MLVRVRTRDLGRTDYREVFRAMQAFTAERDPKTTDEIWLTEHDPVFTQGQAGKEEHLIAPGDIPVVQSDRGGQVTYHGPGQIVGYLLFDLRRMGLSVRRLVSGIEDAVVNTLACYGISGVSRADARGVYVDNAKIAALGLRVRRGCSYHGLSLNVNMDLAPYAGINPCGLTDIGVTQMCDLGGPDDIETVKRTLLDDLAAVYEINLDMLDTGDP